jgi:hypothetical protein
VPVPTLQSPNEIRYTSRIAPVLDSFGAARAGSAEQPERVLESSVERAKFLKLVSFTIQTTLNSNFF